MVFYFTYLQHQELGSVSQRCQLGNSYHSSKFILSWHNTSENDSSTSKTYSQAYGDSISYSNIYQELIERLRDPSLQFNIVYCSERERLLSGKKGNKSLPLDSLVTRLKHHDNLIDKQSNETDKVIIAHRFSHILQYMSIITITFKHQADDYNGKNIFKNKGKNFHTNRTIIIESRSACILPPWFPFVSFWMRLIYWIPYSDLGVNKKYLTELIFESNYLNNIHPNFQWNIQEQDSSEINNEDYDYLPGSAVFFLSFIVIPIVSMFLLLIIYSD